MICKFHTARHAIEQFAHNLNVVLVELYASIADAVVLVRYYERLM